MTTDEAIKLIQADIDDENVDWDSSLGRAYKLSFEALKAWESSRKFSSIHQFPLLPGEDSE